MAKLFDSHAHYTDGKFDAFEGGARALLDSLFANEVGCVVNAATDLADAQKVIEISAEYANMYAAVGIHPEFANDPGRLDGDMENLERMLLDAEKYKIVAVGEIGYDFYRQPYDLETQKRYFEEQMRLAGKYGLPVVIHDREAHGACLDMVSRFNGAKGVFHGFGGSPEMANELAKSGFYISFSGVLTFKNAKKLPETAEKVPEDKILTETDAPYLTPVPHRGEINHSGLMRHTVEKLALIRGVSYEEMLEKAEENGKRLFGIRNLPGSPVIGKKTPKPKKRNLLN